MSMHGTLTDKAFEAMTDERRRELREAAHVIADVLGMTRAEMVSHLSRAAPGHPFTPDTEAALSAMTDRVDKCLNHPNVSVRPYGAPFCGECREIDAANPIPF